MHKLTRNSPDGRTRNRMDHIITNNKWRGSLKDVMAKRGADVASDHTFILAKIKFKLSKAKKSDKSVQRIDVQSFKNFSLEKLT